MYPTMRSETRALGLFVTTYITDMLMKQSKRHSKIAKEALKYLRFLRKKPR
jgi:hypothetical protein